MVAVLELTPDEAWELKEAFDARTQKLTEWLNGPEGQALYAEQEALSKAVEDRDVQGVRAITRKATTERDKFQALIDSTEEDIRIALTRDQRIQWDAHRLTTKMFEVLADVPLTEFQKHAIREWAPTHVEMAMRGREPNPIASAYVSLEKEITNRLLTDDQRPAFEAANKKNPMRTLGF